MMEEIYEASEGRDEKEDVSFVESNMLSKPNRIDDLPEIVYFHSLEKPEEDDFVLELSKLDSYNDVAKKVAGKIGLEDPTKVSPLLIAAVLNNLSQPMNYRGIKYLKDMLIHYDQVCDILHYEVLDIPLPEVQALSSLKLVFHHATRDEVQHFLRKMRYQHPDKP